MDTLSSQQPNCLSVIYPHPLHFSNISLQSDRLLTTEPFMHRYIAFHKTSKAWGENFLPAAISSFVPEEKPFYLLYSKELNWKDITQNTLVRALPCWYMLTWKRDSYLCVSVDHNFFHLFGSLYFRNCLNNFARARCQPKMLVSNSLMQMGQRGTASSRLKKEMVYTANLGVVGLNSEQWRG